MPKMKSNSGAKKRFKVTGSGKLRRHHAGTRHKLGKKRASTKRALGGSAIVSAADVPRLKDILPYS